MKVLVVGRTGVAGQATVADRACWGVLVIGMKTDVAYHQLCIQQPVRKRAGLSYGVLSGRCTQKTCGSKPELFQINVLEIHNAPETIVVEGIQKLVYLTLLVAIR